MSVCQSSQNQRKESRRVWVDPTRVECWQQPAAESWLIWIKFKFICDWFWKFLLSLLSLSDRPCCCSWLALVILTLDGGVAGWRVGRWGGLGERVTLDERREVFIFFLRFHLAVVSLELSSWHLLGLVCLHLACVIREIAHSSTRLLHEPDTHTFTTSRGLWSSREVDVCVHGKWVAWLKEPPISKERRERCATASSFECSSLF